MSILISVFIIQAAAAAPASPTPATTAPDDAKVVCRTVQETGSRLGGKRVCMTKKDWRRMHEESQATAAEYQNHQSKQGDNQ